MQAAAEAGRRRLYSRSGDDISAAFPDLVAALDFDGALDGELLVRRAEDGAIAPFAELQQRLNRKSVTPAHLRRYPAHLRAYDLLQQGPRDLRPQPFAERRAALETSQLGLDPDAVRPLAAAALRDLGRARRAARRPAHAGGRGGDAEAARQPLCPRASQGPLVQVETRPARHRRGADVRPARPRQALGLLLGLHLRRLGGRTGRWCRSARPTSASPTPSSPRSTASCG